MIIGGMLIGPDGDNLASTCVEKLATFLDDDDQNLKYIALLALVKIVPTHSHLVALHQEQIFEAMEDDDLSIRLRALDLVSGMAGRSNFRSIVEHQLEHLEPDHTIATTTAAASLKHALQGNTSHTPSIAPWLTASYRLEIITRIINLGCRDMYSNVIDFEWYVDILIKLAYLANESVGDQIRFQLIDVASRVRAVRPHAIAKLKQVLEDSSLYEGPQENEFHLLRAAAWICGEYCQSVSYPPALITLLLRRETLQTCSPVTVSMMLHNAVKLFAWWMLELSKDWKEEQIKDLKEMTKEFSEAMQYWMTSEDAEVEERAVEYRQLLLLLEKDLESYTPIGGKNGEPESQQESENNGAITEGKEDAVMTKGPKSLLLLSPLFFGHTLGPVAKKAQSKVGVPASLDLDEWIIEPGQLQIVDLWDVEEKPVSKEKFKASSGKGRRSNLDLDTVPSTNQAEAKENARLKAERLKREQESPFYIGKKATLNRRQEVEMDIDEIPIVQLQLDDVLVEKSRAQKSQEKPVVAMEKEDEEMPEEEEGQQVVKKKVGTKKKRKGKAVGEGSLM